MGEKFNYYLKAEKERAAHQNPFLFPTLSFPTQLKNLFNYLFIFFIIIFIKIFSTIMSFINELSTETIFGNEMIVPVMDNRLNDSPLPPGGRVDVSPNFSHRLDDSCVILDTISTNNTTKSSSIDNIHRSYGLMTKYTTPEEVLMYENVTKLSKGNLGKGQDGNETPLSSPDDCTTFPSPTSSILSWRAFMLHHAKDKHWIKGTTNTMLIDYINFLRNGMECSKCHSHIVASGRSGKVLEKKYYPVIVRPPVETKDSIPQTEGSITTDTPSTDSLAITDSILLNLPLALTSSSEIDGNNTSGDGTPSDFESETLPTVLPPSTTNNNQPSTINGSVPSNDDGWEAIPDYILNENVDTDGWEAIPPELLALAAEEILNTTNNNKKNNGQATETEVSSTANQDALFEMVYGIPVPSKKLVCSDCFEEYCGACGINISNPGPTETAKPLSDAERHIPAYMDNHTHNCSLRYAYNVALQIEKLRRVVAQDRTINGYHPMVHKDDQQSLPVELSCEWRFNTTDSTGKSITSTSTSTSSTTTSTNKSGTGYAGSEDDASIIKARANEIQKRHNERDAEISDILIELRKVLPSTVYDNYKVSTANGTDLASDHPLVLQLLLNPGYADGMTLIPPSITEHPNFQAYKEYIQLKKQQPEETENKEKVTEEDTITNTSSMEIASSGSKTPEQILEERPMAGSPIHTLVDARLSTETIVVPSKIMPPTVPETLKNTIIDTTIPSASPFDTLLSSLVTVSNTSGQMVTESTRNIVTGEKDTDVRINKSKNFTPNGLSGCYTLYKILSDLLRTSMMDVTTAIGRRTALFSALQLLQALAKHPTLACFLLFSPPEDSASSSDSSPMYAWIPDEQLLSETTSTTIESNASSTEKQPDTKLVRSSHSLASILHKFAVQAKDFAKRTSKLIEKDINEATEENMSLLCLASDVEITEKCVKEGLDSFTVTFKAYLDDLTNRLHSRELSVPPESKDTSSSATETSDQSNIGASCKDNEVTSNSSSSSSSSSPSTDSSNETDSYKPGEALKDPVSRRRFIAVTRVGYVPTKENEKAYTEIMEEEVNVVMDDIKSNHALLGTYSDSSSSSSSSSKKGSTRNTHINAEMSTLGSSLIPQWGSSILVRSDQTSSNYLRVMMFGPEDTPYMDGCWMFDIYLPASYPQEPPKVLFTTTDSAGVRMNPNLYADGKVCLSLLGTWKGPGWIAGVSTLSQVLMSIQSQILVDIPYMNEPSYENALKTSAGRRAITKQNVALRLATLRYGMLDHLAKPIAGFKRATNTHFLYKREEIKRLSDIWLQDAKDLAIYEQYLMNKVAVLKAVVDIVLDKEWTEQRKKWEADEAAKREAAEKDTASSTPSTTTKSSSSSSAFTFTPSAELVSLQQKVMNEEKVYRQWVTETTLSCHTVFKRGLGTITPENTEKIQKLTDEYIQNSDTKGLVDSIVNEVSSIMHLTTDEIQSLAFPSKNNTPNTVSSTTTSSTESSSSSSSSSTTTSSTASTSTNRYAFEKTTWRTATGFPVCSSYQTLRITAHSQHPMIQFAAATQDAVDSIHAALDKLTEADLVDDEFVDE